MEYISNKWVLIGAIHAFTNEKSERILKEVLKIAGMIIGALVLIFIGA